MTVGITPTFSGPLLIYFKFAIIPYYSDKSSLYPSTKKLSNEP